MTSLTKLLAHNMKERRQVPGISQAALAKRWKLIRLRFFNEIHF